MTPAPHAFTWPSRIRFVDTDASGRIHYTALFRYFEAAEFEFMRSIGHPYGRLDPAEVIRYPRVHVEADFLAALRCDDDISTQVAVERVGGASYTLAFTVLLDGSKAAAGKITVVCMHSGTGRSHPLPADLAARLRERMGP
jgi:YbgC/YbaW family acyl-CoA thioester hydrolase